MTNEPTSLPKRPEAWLLYAFGGGKPYYFTTKHLALESLELTYPEQKESQGIHIRWHEAQTMAEIAVDHVGNFCLVQVNLRTKPTQIIL